MNTVNAQATLDKHGLEAGEYFFATIHRAENTDDRNRLESIMQGLARVARDHPVVLPAHPRTRPRIRDLGIPAGIRIIEPVGHAEAMALVQHAAAVLTDSGGLQKEVYWLETPCITLRTETEWVETVAAGWNRLAAADPAAIEVAVKAALTDRPPHPDLYGDGNTARCIVDRLLAFQPGDEPTGEEPW
jgi:UDP-N-acetylglucosamine 2-epimerase